VKLTTGHVKAESTEDGYPAAIGILTHALDPRGTVYRKTITQPLIFQVIGLGENQELLPNLHHRQIVGIKRFAARLGRSGTRKIGHAEQQSTRLPGRPQQNLFR